jgi:serine protease 16
MCFLLLLSIRLNLEFPTWFPTVEYENRIDHFNPSDTRTFKQRSYANMDHASAGQFDRALLYIGGEGPLANTSIAGGNMIELATRLHCPIFGLEHRFFGLSHPFPDTGSTNDNLKYLSIEQSLADLAQYIDEEIFHHPNASPNLRLAVIGGSYPGSLSAWFRLKYPHLAFASWASSAPVEIQNDFQAYDAHMAAQLDANKAGCLGNVKAVLDHFHTVFSDPAFADERLAIRAQYGFWDNQTDVSVLYVLVDSLAIIIQYNTNLQLLDGLGGNVTGVLADDLATYFQFVTKAYALFGGVTVQDMDLELATDPSPTAPSADARAWSYVTCTEVGWFQTASGRLRSPWINLTYFQDVCSKLFDLATLPNEVELNNRYGGKNGQGVRTFFLNGEVDPWSTMGIETADETILRRSLVIGGASHCADLRAAADDDPEPLRSAKLEVVGQLEEWLNEWNCTGKCGEHGRCVVNACVCEDNWGGSACDAQTASKASYNAALYSAIVIPIVLAVVVVVLAVVLLRKRPTKASQPLLPK